jgi:hypothetical protein
VKRCSPGQPFSLRLRGLRLNGLLAGVEVVQLKPIELRLPSPITNHREHRHEVFTTQEVILSTTTRIPFRGTPQHTRVRTHPLQVGIDRIEQLADQQLKWTGFE